MHLTRYFRTTKKQEEKSEELKSAMKYGALLYKEGLEIVKIEGPFESVNDKGIKIYAVHIQKIETQKSEE